jgi:hypothetical protein
LKIEYIGKTEERLRLAKILMTGAMIAPLSLSAAEVTGKVSAVKGLHLNGESVPVSGTTSWPVGAGDELRSENAPVVLQLKDGSRVVLGRNSQARLEEGVVRLVRGSMEYEMTRESRMQVAAREELIPARSGAVTAPAAGGPVSVKNTGTVGATAKATVVTTTASTLPPVSRRRP